MSLYRVRTVETDIATVTYLIEARDPADAKRKAEEGETFHEDIIKEDVSAGETVDVMSVEEISNEEAMLQFALSIV